MDKLPDLKVLPRTWVFCCKQYLDGSVQKLKARFCARGDKQIQSVDFLDTFTPVVNWTTVHLMIILMIIMNLATCQVNYTAALVQTPMTQESLSTYHLDLQSLGRPTNSNGPYTA